MFFGAGFSTILTIVWLNGLTWGRKSIPEHDLDDLRRMLRLLLICMIQLTSFVVSRTF